MCYVPLSKHPTLVLSCCYSLCPNAVPDTLYVPAKKLHEQWLLEKYKMIQINHPRCNSFYKFIT